MTDLPLFVNFLSQLQKNNCSEETIYSYERDLKSFLDFLNKRNIIFNKINRKIIDDYKSYLLSLERKTARGKNSNKQLSSHSINRMLSALRTYLRYLTDSNYTAPIFGDGIKLLKTEKRHASYGTTEDLERLIESPTQLEKNKMVGLRNRAMLEILFSTGMRISELLNFKTDQIDKSGRIFIRGKGKKERFVYLTPRAQKQLKNYLETRTDNSPFVFVPYSGSHSQDKNKKITPSYLQRKIKEYRELLGINIPLSAHGIRHAFATYLAESGANPAAIQILLGHESLDTTTRYVHTSDRYAQKIHRKYHPLKE